MTIFKVLIVEDDPFMRVFMRYLLAQDPEIRVVGEAQDGHRAVELDAALEPDVITMDLEMPGMDGLEATEAIMRRAPKPIIMVSAFTREDTEATIRALELGAADFISKSSDFLDMDIAHLDDALLKTVRAWAGCAPEELKRRRRANLQRLQAIKEHLGG